MHYFKGLHRDFPAACATRTVPAVTGACLMVARDLYQELGGLRDLYVLGGYEDSDFCIRLLERGRHNWYLSEVELFHLEAQSFESPVRPLATAYNTWLQTHFWDDAIARIMHDQAARELVLEGQSGAPGRLSSVA
jgi:GT2 family glycosyltransferase